MITRISKGGTWAIFLGRLTPFIRGYTSVITGFLQIKPKVFVPITIISAVIWSSACVIFGKMLGPYWSDAESKIGNIKTMALIAVFIILIIIAILFLRKRSRINQK